MSRRPQASRSRPQGSTGANSAGPVSARLARCKRWSLSPYPRKTRDQKKADRARRSKHIVIR